MERPDILTTCRHCGNHTILQVLYHDDLLDEGHYGVALLLLRCRSCKQASLVRRDWERDLSPEWEFHADDTVLYPDVGASEFQFLPETIRKEYESAMNIMRHDSNAFGVKVRCTLEAVCKDRGLQGRTLIDNLRGMASRNEMPGTLADIADHLRVVGNIGAHHTDREISKDDLPVLRDFLNLVLEYLYEAPGRLGALQAKASSPEPEADDSEA